MSRDIFQSESQNKRIALVLNSRLQSETVGTEMPRLSVSDNLFSALIQNSTDIITVLNPQGIVLYESPSVQKITGFFPEELVNKNIFEFIHPQDAESVLQSFSALLEYPNQAGHSEFRFLKKTGDWCHLEVVGTNLLNDPQVHGIVINSRDITERKIFQQALAKSEAKFRSLIDNSSDLIFIIAAEGDISFINRPISDAFGYRMRRLSALRMLSLVHHEDIDELTSQWDEMKSGRIDLFRMEVRFKNVNQAWNVYELTCINLLEDLSVQGILVNARDVTQRKNTEEKLKFLALNDPLTSLANRTYFSQCIENQFQRRLREPDYLFSLIFLDLDHFKMVNDGLGHAAGDQLLQQIAKRLTTCVRSLDIVARLGGDEFAILLADVSSIEQVIRVADRIRKVLKTPFVLEGKEVFSSASMGIALSTPETRNPDELLRDADTALYRAKENGRGGYEIFDQEMHLRAVNFLHIETELRKALDANALELYYQPIFALSTGKLKGMEALIRWKHPYQGFIEPDRFIPIAEETGLIESLGWWVFQEACSKLKSWNSLGQDFSDLYVSINLSTRQFKQTALVEKITDALEDYAINPSRLCLEITESVLIQDPEAATEMFSSLRDLGVQLFMDDFGTGYSSLSYLQRFPVDALKIDRSFIRHINEESSRGSMEDMEIVRAIASLAKNLGIHVIAEGIEQQAQLRLLQDINCDYGQGFLFAKPMEAEQAQNFILANFDMQLT